MYKILITMITILFLSSCDNSYSYKSAIEKVLVTDEQIGTTSKDIKETVSRMNKINLNNCPQDFSQAYIKHVNAWQNKLHLENSITVFEKLSKAPQNVNQGVYETVMAPALIADAMSLMEQARINKRNISSTYNMVKSIAVKYNARIPNN